MSTQPEALRLADAIDYPDVAFGIEAAAELRRLHEKCEALTADTIEEMNRIVEIRRLTAQRDALLEALRWIDNVNAMDYEYQKVARAAIKAVEEGK